MVFLKAETVRSQNILKGYKILNIARRDVPLGAQWIDGVGPDGDGTTSDNIRFTESVDYLNVDNAIKASITLSIIKYLGIRGDYASKIKIQCKNLKIYTVHDISKTSIRTGQYMLYEYITGDSISVVYDKSIKASVELELKQKFSDYKMNASTDQSQKGTFSGRNLALGYRVFEFGKTKVVEKKVKIKDTKDGGGLKELKILNYTFSFNDFQLSKCLGKSIPIDENKLKECGQSNPVALSIRNFSNTDASGKPLSKELKIIPDTYQEFRFSYKSNNNLISDNIKVTYAYKPRSFFLYMSDNSKVELRTTETPLKMLTNPLAAGW
jgi:hypothetical protein